MQLDPSLHVMRALSAAAIAQLVRVSSQLMRAPLPTLMLQVERLQSTWQSVVQVTSQMLLLLHPTSPPTPVAIVQVRPSGQLGCCPG